jgi:hypothetical protein
MLRFRRAHLTSGYTEILPVEQRNCPQELPRQALLHLLDGGALDHLFPFFGFGDDHRAKGLRRADQGIATQFDQPHGGQYFVRLIGCAHG